MVKSNEDERFILHVQVPMDMKVWLEERAKENETKVSPTVRQIIRERMNNEKEE